MDTSREMAPFRSGLYEKKTVFTITRFSTYTSAVLIL